MAVGAEPEMHEVEHRRRAGHRGERRRVACRRDAEIRELDRHRVDLLRRQRRAVEQALAEVRQVAVGVAGGRDALVHLEEVHARPRHVLARERAQHQPRRAAAAHGEGEAPARRDRGAGLRGDDRGPPRGHRVGVGEDFELHCGYAVTVGFCQPPGGVTLSPTSFGPQVPGSYS